MVDMIDIDYLEEEAKEIKRRQDALDQMTTDHRRRLFGRLYSTEKPDRDTAKRILEIQQLTYGKGRKK